MIAGKKMHSIGEGVFGAVGEAVAGFAGDDASVEKIGEVAVEGNLAQADDDANLGECLDLAGEEGSAVAYLLRKRFVLRRRATDDGGYPGLVELEAVVAGNAGGLVGKTHVMEYGIHKIAGAVAGEDAACPVGPMRPGSESKDVDAGAPVAEAGDRPAPVGLVPVGAALGFGDTPAIITEAGASLTGDDGLMKLLQSGVGYLYVGTCHYVP